MKLRLGAASVLVAFSVGCTVPGQSSGDDAVPADPPLTSKPPHTPTATPTSAAAAGPCALLDTSAIRRLAGEELEGNETTVAGSGLPACLYGRLDRVGVQVAQAPASEWARALPVMMDQLNAADAFGDPRIRRQLEEAAELIESGSTLPSERACGLFTKMLKLHGDVPAGSDYVVTYIPSDQNPLAASAQACVDGTFTSVAVGKPDLQAGAKLEAALEVVLREARAGTSGS